MKNENFWPYHIEYLCSDHLIPIIFVCVMNFSAFLCHPLSPACSGFCIPIPSGWVSHKLNSSYHKLSTSGVHVHFNSIYNYYEFLFCLLLFYLMCCSFFTASKSLPSLWPQLLLSGLLVPPLSWPMLIPACWWFDLSCWLFSVLLLSLSSCHHHLWYL